MLLQWWLSVLLILSWAKGIRQLLDPVTGVSMSVWRLEVFIAAAGYIAGCLLVRKHAAKPSLAGLIIITSIDVIVVVRIRVLEQLRHLLQVGSAIHAILSLFFVSQIERVVGGAAGLDGILMVAVAIAPEKELGQKRRRHDD